MDQLVTITLFGKPYTFKAEPDSTRAKEVVDFLVREVDKVESKQSNHSSETAKIAILISAALNIANEHMDLKRSHTDTLRNISERSTDLIRVLDANSQ